MKRKQTGDGLMQDNEQFRKIRDSEPGQKTPRENPGQQGPGKGGYGRPEFEQWTVEELREFATTLEVPNAESLSREQLVEELTRREVR